ncbi:hypothetical protein AG0111_0g1244 [Alternaria gaisen]|uniref:Uncharacterized protein n=1 Tax=Alternaria gaisen TaxID=167740 RepID=A0ACB6G181_9PLEO|nr:hypothetical protein AG0111_0g1244 [Alternaria gaisen]
MLGAVKTAFVAIRASDVIVTIALGPILAGGTTETSS